MGTRPWTRPLGNGNVTVCVTVAILVPGLACLAASQALAGPPGTESGSGPQWVASQYTKYEYRIPMRDGTRLFTAVYVPKDQSQRYPILLTRTPYSVAPYGADRYRSNLGPSPSFAREGYIFAYQDVRGRWMSE